MKRRNSIIDENFLCAMIKIVAIISFLLLTTANSYAQCGIASYYGNKFKGNHTASGEIFNPNKLTAAHRTLPFGTKIKVTNRKTGKAIVVRINDRGPFLKGRVIDLSTAAAIAIGIKNSGIGQVCLEKVK